VGVFRPLELNESLALNPPAQSPEVGVRQGAAVPVPVLRLPGQAEDAHWPAHGAHAQGEVQAGGCEELCRFRWFGWRQQWSHRGSGFRGSGCSCSGQRSGTASALLVEKSSTLIEVLYKQKLTLISY